jgi:hypothetical protein
LLLASAGKGCPNGRRAMKTLADWVPVWVGMAVAAALFGIGVWLRLRRRAQVGESPPQAEKLLRPPGHYLQEELERLDEALMMAVFYLLASGALAGPTVVATIRVGWVMIEKRITPAQVLAEPNGYLVLALPPLALGASAWVIWSLWRLFTLMDQSRSHRLGLRGELATAEALRDPRLALAGFTAFHDVPGDGPWNIDHVVVGPAGVFVLETKTCRRRKRKRFEQRDYDVLFDGAMLRFPWREDDKAVRQVTRNARWLRKYIASFAPEDIHIQPVIVVPGWYVKAQGNYPVKVMNAEYLIDYLLHERRLYKPDQLKGILGRFDERCRTIGF